MKDVRTDGQPKRVFIRTYGCQMNVYDSDRMADVLRPLGYALAEGPEQADLVVLNTCHIREQASEKVYSELGRLRAVKTERRAEGRDLTIAVAGCVAQAEGAEIIRRQPAVDIVVGSQAYHRLPELLAQVARKAAGSDAGRRQPGAGVLDTEFPPESKFDHLPSPQGIRAGSAFLSIQEGCDKFCTFCVVPYTRGMEYSRPVAAVLTEARQLVAAGALELTLLGQNVNAYHGEGPDGSTWSLARLLRAIGEIPGLARLRYTTSHPRDMDDGLIAAHGDVPQLMPYLHLPVQSGSNRILEAMNRRHDRDLYLRIVERLRNARADLALSSDFIVGFPGESDADFDDTMRLIEQVGFASAYAFRYSRRPGTPGAALIDQVPENVKVARLAALQALVGHQARRFNESKAGSTVPVLFAEAGRKPGQIMGKTPWLQSVYAQGNPRLFGHIVDVRLIEGYANSLLGEIVVDPYEAAA
ncbi:tRNA (N6-isopentenyl adenosine(37)-C2)-methylthiotransferase MiaB [Reyranella sp.]|uniref:tRNA (N6-isopentenyl adenosine(37)-C2)-methylthiotransferase MiaB n=1 Tax=Reyranella sp. TaxID=1929291 RepID=UPI00271B7566|nr:tRNA (N6-isopentenyl adenosine(37)-C2)-methylthiotransferase MiaB [Reyranella sp.]MDO8977104.1 tRNA (N6-isopentenyl adenosine(37)-C2)-methylthiotransferase MiaB [Reyranella sp.]MDP3240632.1 tRNA (N6-isopentenyl adenosine(37)-C2)-methylthiotransferase MiaB [Reyranella sp.]